MPLLNYTTSIAPMKTVSEIQTLLTRAGAKRIMVENNDNREPVALAFELAGYSYRLPCRHEAVYLLLWKDRDVPRRFSTREQGLRVAWRILKNWVEAQVAIVESEMVKMDEVFLPYQVTSSGQTVYEHYAGRLLEQK